MPNNMSATSTSIYTPNFTQLLINMQIANERAVSHGDTAFVVLSAALVFFMTPGLGYFYSGMARSKNALSLIFLSFLSMAVVLLQWTLFGFSLTFSEYGGPFIGDCSYCGATNLGLHCIPPTSMNSISFFIYQGMFATITCALMFGSSAERVRIMPAMIFMFVWTTVVYDPIAYWTWAKNGWLNKLGSLDYAGGTPVHIASGFAGLAKALVLGKRLDYDRNKEWKPHSLSNVFLGTAILWFGWFGFNGGSALAGTVRAAFAAAVTCIAASTGGLTWVLFDYRNARKLSALGFCSGAVAALVAITPGSGFVAPWSAIVIGFVAGIACNMGCRLKHKLGYDDALDVFGTHGLGGFLGNLLVGILAQKWVAAMDETAIDGGWLDGHFAQMLYQLAGSAAGAAWSFFWTLVIVWSMDCVPFLSLRLEDLDQELGVDIAQMGETAYTEMMRKKSVDVKPLGVFTVGRRVSVKNGPTTTTLENGDLGSPGSKRDEKMVNQAALGRMSIILEVRSTESEPEYFTCRNIKKDFGTVVAPTEPGFSMEAY